MTRIESHLALEHQTRVAGGEPGTEDYDEGYIVEITDDETALVAWESGVRTATPIVDLQTA